MKIYLDIHEFVAIGKYEDNKDGILGYFPNDSSPVLFYEFLISQDLAIKALSIGYLTQKFKEEVKTDFIDIFDENINNIISSNLELINSFYDSYFEDMVFNKKFLDLVFGKYTPSKTECEPINLDDRLENEPYIYSDGSKLLLSGSETLEDLTANMFINSIYYNDFTSHLDRIIIAFKPI